jgi:hypothetical protein
VTPGGKANLPPAAPEAVTEPGIDVPSGPIEATEKPLGVLARAAVRNPIPVGLIAAVVTFLLAQGLVDRRNPKLMAAPLDSADDTLRFE